MRSAVLFLAAFAFAEGLGVAEMVSNYAKVATNSGVAGSGNRYEPRTESAPSNETDYEDFDDLESNSDDAVARGPPVGAETMLKYVNGVVNLLALMNRFGGGVRSAAEPRFQSDAASTKAKRGGDAGYQPIENYPPYNPNAVNSAESYSQNGMKTSYDTDVEEYKSGSANPMSDYMTQNRETSLDGRHAFPYADGHDSSWKGSPYDSPHGSWTPENVYGTWKEEKPAEWTGGGHHQVQYLDHHHLDVDDHAIRDEDRESKRPYSYYFLGRKLWYIPLIFSVYFIIYIGALVLKSIARHKIQFPDKLWDLKDHHGDIAQRRRAREVDALTESYENAIDTVKNKFM